MASLVKFTPISGCLQEFSPLSYLLEIDTHKILLDCGLPLPNASGQFDIDESYLRTLKKVVKNVDAVLLSHGDLQHCGALPIIIKDLNPTALIYATVPVHHLGLMTLYDTLQSLEPFCSSKKLASFGYDEVDSAFDKIQTLRYSQSVHLAGSITVCPLPAGHSLGGSMWRIKKPPAEDILYTPAFNHKRESHLEGALFDAITRPSLMIVNSQQALAPSINKKDRDSAFFTAINGVIRNGGHVLIPVDSASRVLEVAYTLDSGWNEFIKTSSNQPARAYLLTNQSYRTLEFAKGMLEWMSASVMKSFDSDRMNPFDFKHIRPIHTAEEISFSSPAIILACSESLDFGLSHALLQVIGKSSSNCILSLFESKPNSLLSKLLSSTKLSEIQLKIWKKNPLEGEELARHYEAELEEKERKAAEIDFAAFEKSRREQGNGLDLDSGGTDDPAINADEEQNFSELLERRIDDAASFRNIFWVDYRNDCCVAANIPGDPIYQLMVSPENISDSYMNIGASRSRFQCFPVREISKSINEYGEVVHAAEFEARDKQEVSAIKTKSDMEEQSSARKMKTSSEDVSTIPFKWESQAVQVVLKCSRKQLTGFSGLSDGRSLKTIINRINPRKLVLVGGGLDATEFLLNHFILSSSEGGLDAFAPKLLETINVSSSMNLMPAIISEVLLNQIRVSYLQDYEISRLQAQVQIKQAVMDVDVIGSKDNTNTDMELFDVNAVNNTANEKARPVQSFEYELVPVPLSMIPPGPTLMIGDIKLSDLRRHLSTKYASSIRAEFTASGDLICNDKILVKKDQTSGQFFVEGPICKEFYQIRNSLYENIVMV